MSSEGLYPGPSGDGDDVVCKIEKEAFASVDRHKN